MTSRTSPKQDTDGGFLRRWSRRKAGAEPPEEEPARDPPPGEEPPRTAEAEDVKTDSDMPLLESIGPDSDISDFFSPGVSEALRNQALRRLFHLSTFNVTDGLDDYAEDYRHFASLGDIVTADMRHHMEREQARNAEASAESEDRPGDGPAGPDEEAEPPSETAGGELPEDEPRTGEAADGTVPAGRGDAEA